MAKVSYKCRLDCRTALQSAGLEVDFSDSDLDSCVKAIRKEAGRCDTDDLKLQTEGLLRALGPFKDFVLEGAEGQQRDGVRVAAAERAGKSLLDLKEGLANAGR